MNRIIIVILCIVAIVGAIFTAIIITRSQDNDVKENVVERVSDIEILDECTDEYEKINKEDEIKETNSEEEKISPNCSLTIKNHYKDCNHTTSQYFNIPEDLVNKTEDEIKNKYTDYKIEKFSSNEIVLLKENVGECGEHYILKDKDGQIVVYSIDSNGKENEYEKTCISTEYLTDADKVNIKNGIRVNGKQELNQMIEDFE